MTRQNYYKTRSIRQRESVDGQLVVELVRRERQRQPMLGARKVLHMIRPELEAAEVKIGRDRFFEVLGHNHLLLPRRKRSARTTDSRHGFAVYPNRAKDLTLTGPHQLLVSDITYVRTEQGFVYLALTMDAFSRSIVGFDCSDSLEMDGALRSLAMAIKQRPAGVCEGGSEGGGEGGESATMHHSDRGIQYCCRSYIERLVKAGMRISMTQDNHCYENSKAERLNGTMKREYGLGQTWLTKAEAYRAVGEAVTLYNHHRPHQALGYQVPMRVHHEHDLLAA